MVAIMGRKEITVSSSLSSAGTITPYGQHLTFLWNLDAGYVEVCGQDIDGIHTKVKTWLKNHWGCGTQVSLPGQEPLADAKYTWKPRDIMVATGEITSFFHNLGWQMQVCSQGTVKVKGNPDSREQQIVVRPGASGL